jgi:hypothetical protein
MRDFAGRLKGDTVFKSNGFICSDPSSINRPVSPVALAGFFHAAETLAYNESPGTARNRERWRQGWTRGDNR